MLGVVWRSERGAKLAAQLLKLLVEAASKDPFLESIVGDPRHCHGYGYTGLIYRGGGRLLVWHKYDAADFMGVGEESCKANLARLREDIGGLEELVLKASRGLIVVHARRAGRREPRGSLHAHPYLHVNASRHGYTVVALAHNGSIEKEPLASLLGLDPTAYTDSGVLAVWVSRQVSYGVSVRDALVEARQYTRSALDVLVVEFSRDYARLHIHGYVRKDLDRKRVEYYRPYVFDSGDAAGYASSTIVQLAYRRGLDLGKVDDRLDKHVSLEL